MIRSRLLQAPYGPVPFSDFLDLNVLANTDVLFVNGNYDKVDRKFRDFFNVIVTDNLEALSVLDADIFIDRRPTPYTDGVFDLDHFNKEHTLFLVNHQFLDIMTKAKKRLSAYVCSVGEAVDEEVVKLGQRSASFRFFDSQMDSVNELMAQKGRYGIPLNLKYAKRRNIIDLI